MLRTLSRFGIDASRLAGLPGVWVGGAKIGAVGVRVQGGVTTHGFALNVDVNLAWFDAIVPCGIAGAGVTNMQRILGTSLGVEAIADVIEHEFASVLRLTPSPSTGRGQGVGFAHAR
jgi:lipoate-protein ligase B